MPDAPPITEARRRVLRLLKRLGPASARSLAEHLEITAVAARQHLAALEEGGLVESEARPPAGRGRPSVAWSLTERARPLFPDQHAELAVGLIDAIRRSEGEDGLMRIVEVRARDQVNLYRDLVPPPGASLRRRVEALAAQRTAEGYMAEVVSERPGTYLLVERHCPICDAARACQGICRAELEVFRETLGPDVEIERTTHLLTDGDRCAYRIRKRRNG
jgi:predicted ArsR family transcriptional regulator